MSPNYEEADGRGAYTVQEQTESSTSMEHVLAIMQVMMKGFVEECLNFGRTREQVVMRGR